MTHDYWTRVPATAVDPFEAAAIRRLMGFRPPGGRQEGAATRVLERLMPHVLHRLVTLPQRALAASEQMRLGGGYDPAPIPEAATVALRAPLTPRTGLASKSASLYDPPAKPARDFDADYPANRWPEGAHTDAAGRLTHDIEGRPLGARHVVGRRTVGAADEALTPARIHAVAAQALGIDPVPVAARRIGGDAGRIGKARDLVTGEVRRAILYDRVLASEVQARVIAHELGHVLDFMSAKPGRPTGVSTRGIRDELAAVYSTLAKAPGRVREQRPLLLPESFGYGSGPASDRELAAESIRAYLADPNYLKTVAPNAAKAIRAAVNPHPVLSKIIQFNGLAGVGLRGASGRGPSAAEVVQPGM